MQVDDVTRLGESGTAGEVVQQPVVVERTVVVEQPAPTPEPAATEAPTPAPEPAASEEPAPEPAASEEPAPAPLSTAVHCALPMSLPVDVEVQPQLAPVVVDGEVVGYQPVCDVYEVEPLAVCASVYYLYEEEGVYYCILPAA